MTIQYPKFDLYHATRALIPSVAVFTILKFGFPDASSTLSISGLKGVDLFLICFVIAICIDFVSPYKMHPIYRSIRKHFFLRLYKIINKKAIRSDDDRINIAEVDREDLLYNLGEERFKNMRMEHAIWISLYNASIILLLFSVFCAADLSLKLGATQLDWIWSAAMFSTSCIILVSAVARNRSYGAKILVIAEKSKQNNIEKKS